jgi:DNA-binding NarL/FixJ family response regulator
MSIATVSPAAALPTRYPRAATAAPRIRLFVADGHVLFRQALRVVLEGAGFTVVGEASDGREALRAVMEVQPDIALVDLTLPALNGAEFTQRLKRMGCSTRVVILSARAEEPLLLRILQSGASGYLLKEADLQELTAALRKVHAGYSYLAMSLEGRTLDYHLRRQRGEGGRIRRDLLTTRERELLQLVAEGYTNREIASQLCLSVKTVEAHKANICGKLNVRGQAGLVRHAISAGLIGIGA